MPILYRIVPFPAGTDPEAYARERWGTDLDSIVPAPNEPGTYVAKCYSGRVLADREANYYDDSDFYAVVVADDGSTQRVVYDSTRCAPSGARAVVDVTPERVEALKRVLQAQEEEERRRKAEEEARTPSKGKRVVVTSKRSKVPHGTTGTVVWYGESGYRGGGMRVGFKDEQGQTHFCDAKCVAIVME